MCITFQSHICNIPTCTREDAADHLCLVVAVLSDQHIADVALNPTVTFSPPFSGQKECCMSLNKFDVIEYYLLAQNV